MGNGCTLAHNRFSKNIQCSAVKELIPVLVNSEIKFIKMPLSGKEIETLKKSWTTAKQFWNEICTCAFSRWFSTYPEIQSKFGVYGDNLTMNEVLASESLCIHIRKSVELIEIIIKKVDERHELSEYLIELGKLHHKFGAEQKYATALGSSFVFAISQICPNIDMITEGAWDSLFKYIVTHIKLGIRLESGTFKKESAKIIDSLLQSHTT
ncbi:uncharacterized protein LOC100205225 isoform X1 [Hydra vulgaris]|uniref:uncharacterized protein LOC100205225 isoform X1 n=1 Tax=Hydra vulgaris TaxID=6087 RepID=UPI000640D0D9|nr:uncharacterized protein LOC100205225 [Hydra vulgaris]XP_047122445.1 uncharacterized protein LOC100205225 [Hydra vulgaris]